MSQSDVVLYAEAVLGEEGIALTTTVNVINSNGRSFICLSI